MKTRAQKAGIIPEIDEARTALIETPRSIAFKESKTIAEAGKFARDNLGLSGSSFSGCHIDIANAWNESLTKNLSEFPDVQGLKYVGSFVDAKKKYVQAKTKSITELLKTQYPGIDEERLASTAKKAAQRFAVETYNPNAYGLTYFGDIESIQGIAVNDRFADNPEMLRLVRKREVAGQFKVIGGDSFTATADHEFGHVLDRWLGISDNKDVRDIYDDLLRNEGTSRLSTYGISNINEMIAEAWAEYRNNPAPRETATRIAEIILRRYAEWKKLNS
jgi:hypothetical protein